MDPEANGERMRILAIGAVVEAFVTPQVIKAYIVR